MVDIVVVHLPETEDVDTLTRWTQNLRKLRLRSLQLDSNSFISRYIDEVNMPIESWIDRTRDSRAQHWIGIEAKDGRSETVLTNPWVAFFVVLLPIESAVTSEQVELSPNDVSLEEYSMQAVWVAPEYRGQGVFTKMLYDAVHWITEQTQKRNLTRCLLTTSVRDGNESAIPLYSKLGFEVVARETIEGKDSKQYGVTKMKLDISVGAKVTG